MKKRLMLLVVTLFFVLFAIINANPQNDVTAKEITSQAANADGLVYFKDIGINNIKTGTAAMDDNDNPGYDSSADNDVVRSFDTVVYPLSINLASNDGKAYSNIKIKITGEVANGVSSDGRILNAVFDQSFNGKYDMDARTSTMEYEISGVKTGAAIGYNIPLNVQGATNGLTLGSTFTIQLISAEDEDSNVINFEDEGITEVIQTKDITVSSKVNLKVRINNAIKKNYFNFDSYTNTTDNLPADVTVKGVTVAIQPLEGKDNLIGSAFPTNDIELTLSSSYALRDNLTGLSENLVIGSDIRAMSIFDYGYISTVGTGTIDHLHDTKYDNHIDLSKLGINVSTANLPYSKSTYGQTVRTITDSGNIVATNTDDKMIIKFSDFKITNHFPISSPSSSAITYNETIEKIFASAGFTIVEPSEALKENKTLDYILNVDNALYQENLANKEQTINTNLKWSKTLYPKGSASSHSGYYTNDGYENLGDDIGKTAIATGNAVAAKGQKVNVRSFNQVDGTPYDMVETIQKWNPNESKFDSSRSVTAVCPVNMNGEKPIMQIKYGVAAEKNYSLENLNTKTVDSYKWYDTPQEAEISGEISAVYGICEGSVQFLPDSLAFYVPRIIVGDFGTQTNTTPHITLSGMRVTWNKSNDIISEVGSWDGTKNYMPTEYNTKGDILANHTPPKSYGETLNIQPILVKVSKVSDKKNYDGGEIAKWTITPVIEAYVPLIDEEVTITDTLPKGVEYEAGTAKYGSEVMEPNVISNADGTTTLTWKIEGISEAKLQKITYDTSFNQLTLAFDKAGIAALVNKVVISSPSCLSVEPLRTATYDFNVIKKSQWGIYKSVDTPLIEMSTTDAFTYSLEMYNQSGEDRVNITGFDVLPYNGYLNSNINGSYTITGMEADSSDTKLYYTTQTIDPDSDPNVIVSDVEAGNNGWTEYTGGTLDVAAKAIFFTKPVLEDAKSEIVKVSVLPNGNKAGDFYINRAYGNSDANSKVISNTQKTAVVNRVLEGIAWYDKNYNGLIESSETKLAGIPVTLYIKDSGGNLVKVEENLLGEALIDGSGNSTVLTDASGKYQFNALPALEGSNQYVVGFGIKDKLDDNTYNLTKTEVDGGAIELTNKVSQSDVEGNDVLTAKAAPYEMPLITDMVSATHIQSYVNLGVIEPAVLTIEKDVFNTKDETTSIDTQTIEPGETALYKLVISNTAEHSFADDVTITDTIPEGLTYVAGTLELINADGTTSKLDDSNVSGQNISVNVGTLKGLETVKLSFEVVVDEGKEGAMVNIASVTGEDPIEETVEDDSEEVTITSIIPILTATKVVADASGDGIVENGEGFTYNIYVKNIGQGTAKNVVITDLLNDTELTDSTIKSITVYKDDVEVASDIAIKDGYTIGDMAAASTIKITIVMEAADPITIADKIIENQATIDASNHDSIVTTSDVDENDESTPKDGGDLEKPTTIPVQNPKLVGTKIVSDASGDDIAESNEVLTYTIYYTNIGDLAARDVIIKDLLDDDEFNDATISEATVIKGSETITGDLQAGINVGDIAVNEVVEVTFTVELATITKDVEDATDLIVNQATAKGENTEEVPTTSNVDPEDPTTSLDEEGDEPTPTTIDKGNPSLTATKVVADASGDGIVENGEEFTYNIYVKNIGQVATKDVVITDLLNDTELTDSTIKSITVYKDDVEVASDIAIKDGYTIGDIEAASTIKITIVMEAADPITIADKIIENQATIDASNHDSIVTTSDVDENDESTPKDGGDLEKPTTIPVKNPKLVGTKIVSDANGNDIAESNEVLTYTIYYTNIGDLAARDVIIKDLLDDDEFSDATISEATVIKGSETITGDLQAGINVGDIAVNEVVEVTFTVELATITKDVEDATDLIVNQATAKGENTEEVPTTSNVDPDDPTTSLDEEGDEPTPTTIDKGNPILTATKVVTDCNGDGSAENGEELDYVIHIRNSGQLTAESVNIIDLLDDDEFSGATISKATITKNETLLADNVDLVAGYNMGDLAVDGLISIEFKVTMKNPINIVDKIVSNQATIISNNHEDVLTTADVDPEDPTMPNDPTAPATPTEVPVRNAKLIGTKLLEDANDDGYIENGETITYTLHYTNIGEIPARKVIIKDDLSDDEFVGATISTAVATKDGATYSGDIRTGLNVEDVAVNQTVTVVFEVTMPAKMTNSGATPNLVVNQAQAKAENTPTVFTSSDIDPNDPTKLRDENDEPTPTVYPKENPLLTGTKIVVDTDGDAVFSPNEKLTYTLHFRNIGKVTARDVIIKDPLNDAEFKNALIGEATATKGTNTYTGDIKQGLNVGDVANNELVTVTFTVTMPSVINKDTKSPGVLINQANAKGSNTDIVYTTSDIDPNDPTKPRSLIEKPKSTTINKMSALSTTPVPKTGNDALTYASLLMILGSVVIGVNRKRLFE
ncbi:DUF11 domain-containing protein [Erysipelotrichaceae bacterium OttesenSCG-928-M19]|nr:DUF11 domain-containing protein [Erysipelotrichaceae bacterium OttesenSCG-928-M19]